MDSHEVRREWAERTGEYSPAYYAYYGPNETSESIRGTLDRFVGRDASVLELGCSSGRHLAHLRENGYEELFGIEVNEDAFDVMAESFPELSDAGTFYADAMENVVDRFEEGQFDAVYSVQTLQHVHPDAEWVFDELARITDDVLVTVEVESGRESDDSETGRVARPDDAEHPWPGDPEVYYVTDDVPLYYRNWNGVFTELGFEEVDARPAGTDTVRVFRSSIEGSTD